MSELEINTSVTTQPVQKRQPVGVTAAGKKVFAAELDKAKANSRLDAGFNKLMKYTKIEGYLPEEVTKIKAALKNIYYGSENARELYDHVGNQNPVPPPSDTTLKAITNSKGETILHIKHPELNKHPTSKDTVCYEDRADIPKTIIYINPKNDYGLHYMSTDGDRVLFSLERTIAHESVHAIAWKADPYGSASPFDKGDVVERTNIIIDQLGGKDKRTAYVYGGGSIKPWDPDGCVPKY